MGSNQETIVLSFFDALSTERPGHNASRFMAADGKFYEQHGLPGIQGRDNIELWLDLLMSRLGSFRYETLTLGSAGAKVFFERIERSTLTAKGAIPGYPEGTPLELRIAGVGTIDIDRGEIVEWRDFFTLPHLQKHPSFPEGMPTIA